MLVHVGGMAECQKPVASAFGKTRWAAVSYVIFEKE